MTPPQPALHCDMMSRRKVKKGHGRHATIAVANCHERDQGRHDTINTAPGQAWSQGRRRYSCRQAAVTDVVQAGTAPSESTQLMVTDAVQAGTTLILTPGPFKLTRLTVTDARQSKLAPGQAQYHQRGLRESSTIAYVPVGPSQAGTLTRRAT